MKLGVVADIHGNDGALRAVLADADRFGVDKWWALGDLVLFGPRPVEVLELLRGLPGIEMLRGNTDRYVLTGEQPTRPSPMRSGAPTWWNGTPRWPGGSAGPAACWTRPACSVSWTAFRANWLLVEDDAGQVSVTRRGVPYDATEVGADLHRRRHPNADFVASLLTGARQQLTDAG